MGLREAEDILNSIFADMQRDQVKAIRRDPERHKLTMILGNRDMIYDKHWGGENSTTRFYFCVAETVNAAGYILTWRQRHYKKPRKVRGQTVSGQRDKFKAYKSREAAKRLAKRRAENSLKRLSKT